MCWAVRPLVHRALAPQTHNIVRWFCEYVFENPSTDSATAEIKCARFTALNHFAKATRIHLKFKCTIKLNIKSVSSFRRYPLHKGFESFKVFWLRLVWFTMTFSIFFFLLYCTSARYPGNCNSLILYQENCSQVNQIKYGLETSPSLSPVARLRLH